MTRDLVRDSVGWGVGLWAIGYVLGIALFFVLPVAAIGWILMPIGATITLAVLSRRVTAVAFGHYVALAVVWTVIAVVGDYLFIVRLLNPPDGYYKPDVYLYYVFTALLPLAVGWWRTRTHPRPIGV